MDGPVVVTRRGKPIAVLLAVEDEEDLERIAMAYSPRLNALLEKSEQQIRDGQFLTHDEFWRQMEAETQEG